MHVADTEKGKPLVVKSEKEVLDVATNIINQNGLEEYEDVIKRGALLANDPDNWESRTDITEEEKEVLRREVTHRWHQPAQMYFLAAVGAMAAVVQGMDETVVNGAQLFFVEQFGLTDNTLLQGLVNGAPYLACAVAGVWINVPLSNWFGRRGSIFIGCTLGVAASLWQAFSQSWVSLFVARLLLGISIGNNSASVPVYTAESVPPSIRGGLVMLWQTFTAFGIMLGYIIDVAFMNITSEGGLNWRLMLGSTVVAPLIVMSMIYFGPDTPRYYARKGRYNKAFNSLKRLRWTELQAAADLYLIHESVQEEAAFQRGNPLAELFTVARNRRAALASFIVMFLQQFCGVNVIMYYSSVIFKQAGISDQTAITASLGAGILNFLFALPAIKLIDTWGRRPLLLSTFPLMAAALLFTGFSFFAQDETTRLGLIAFGIYAFMIFYSPGEGPIPFTYSAEAFPLHIRDVGMSFATFVTWTFSFILALVFPAQLAAFTPTGAFCWYAGWCIIGFFLILFFVPETKGYTLEELDIVFSVPTHKHAAYQWRQAGRWIKRKIFRKEVAKENLLELSNTEDLKQAQADQAHATGSNEAQTSKGDSAEKFQDEKGVEHEHVEDTPSA
ncbi:hypothetical protein K450DRAFT_267769 [Umbelopsis ramanniana AG]|uniref:Major facilitator superfamily (MFS) profile domain-containing protein n=1 Tax=Umbelopsis ramanniana AG TaxID=1314678 RepID=A0AAD5EK32_UMBRA|nr:uncharacterized protein K450DRAFT_267769 [Umbelopsis ramanniana AG]KAI8584426.1 hypothetical protein K450DRAFT_267769 [Umbelopsis ramanniana AG]